MELWIPVTVAAAFPAERPLGPAEAPAQQTGHRRRHRCPLCLRGAVRPCLGRHPASSWAATRSPFPAARSWSLPASPGCRRSSPPSVSWRSSPLRTFAAGTAYSKTETVQAAIIGLLILGDPLSVGALAGIIVKPCRRAGSHHRARRRGRSGVLRPRHSHRPCVRGALCPDGGVGTRRVAVAWVATVT